MRHIALLILLLIVTPLLKAQSFRYIDITDGLSNQNVVSIQKDKKGYMWMLTMSGVDRYNGKSFRHYRPADTFGEPGWLFMLHRLHVDADGNVWLVSMREGIMLYDDRTDSFLRVAELPHQTDGGRPLREITFSFIDSNNNLWILSGGDISVWDIRNRQLTRMATDIHEQPLCIARTANGRYAVATSAGIYCCEQIGQRLRTERFVAFAGDFRPARINAMAASCDGHRLFLGTDRCGLFAVDLNGGGAPRCIMSGVCVNVIRYLDDANFLVATDCAGVHRLNVGTLAVTPYLTADYDSPNDIDSNNIRDIYVDDEGRVWMACNPYGVTVLTNSLPRYAWLRHSSHMSDCLVNNNVNDILEDSAGNLWFATGDGISVLSDHGRRWRTLLSRHATPGDAEPRPVLALCEVEPGVVWATGYSDEISVVRGGGASVSTLRTFTEAGEERADKFIQSAYRDADGYVWLGGFYTLRRIDPLTGGCRYYAIDQVSCITARDDRRLWIGTARGLYSLDRKSGSLTQLRLSKRRHTYICSLRQTADGKLYIGTSCSGLMVYDPATGRCRNYNSANSTLITDNIHTIVANGDGSKLVMGTDKGLTQYDVRRDIFRNWTYDQGMLTTYFNATSGVYSSDSSFVMGSNDGVVAFRINSWHDRPMRSRMVLSDMRIDHELVRPGDENSPLTDDIDNTTSITLSHDQNTFSIDLSSINYDYPSDVVYTWRLLGLDSRWTRLDDGGVIRYSALHPGRYTLQVRAVSSESRDHVIEQREIAIRVFPPVWLSLPALLIYAVVLVVAVWLLVRLAAIIRQRRASAEKIDFFVRSAHDIRTPLTLIKAPLEELSRTERFTADGSANMEVAMRNVESLLRLTDNLMNFERASAASATLSRSDHSLGLYVSEQAKPFADYAALRGVSLSFVDHTDGAVVSFDREKMDSVLKNLLSNAVKYTPKGGAVTVTATDGSDAWSVEVADTGIGIPASERRKLFRLYYRASNAVNMSVAGSGVGLMLVRRLVEMHGGKVTLRSVDGGGTSVRISVPKDSKTVVAKVEKSCNAGRRLLIAEDNEELRNYLKHSLETSYDVRLCSNGKQALTEISEYKPDIIISDIMMPEMRGDELCAAVKGNIETSHIPVILLTALSSENDVLHGLSLNADDYIAKPFSVGMLRARIDNLLSNRRLLWRKYVAGSGVEMSQSDVDRLTELDRRFVDDVRRCVLEHVDDRNFNVDTLCGLLNMSRTSFYNKIKALTDSSPADFIRAVRLARAAELLSSGGGYSVTEVAEMSGFNDAKYFREVFRRHYGVSPTKYGGQKKNF